MSTPEPEGRLSLERAREALGEIARLLRTAPPEICEGLRLVGASIAGAFDADPSAAESLRAFLQDRPTRALRLQALSAGRAQELLDADPEARARAVRADGQRLLRDLADVGRPDLILRLLTGVTGLLGDPLPARRMAALQALQALRQCWEDTPFAAARAQVEKDLRRSLEREADPQIHAQLADLAGFIVGARLRKGDLEAAAEILTLLRWQEPTREAAGRAIERIVAGGALQTLSAKIRSGEPAALRVLDAFGEAAPRQLLVEIKRSDVPQARAHFGEILARTGAPGSLLLAEEFRKTLDPTDAGRLLDVLPAAASENEATSALAAVLRHPAPSVRRKTAAILADKAYARSGELLQQALREEKDPDLRLALVEGLGRLRAPEAVEALAAIAAARQESETIRSSACTALGRIGDAEAVPALSELASRPSRGLTALLRPSSSAVRIAALRALGSFVADAAVRELLTAAADDGDPAISDAAREALHARLQRAFSEAPRELPKEGKTKLAGSLQEIPIDQVCQLIAGAEKTGLLQLTLDGATARIWFEAGFVIAAEYRGELDQEAFNAFIRQRQGSFAFQAGEPAPVRRVRLPVANVLLEALRVADESTRAA